MRTIATPTNPALSRGLLTLFSADFPPSGGAAPPTYGEVLPAAPPPRKSKFWLWLIGGLGCSALLCVGCCGGMPFLGLYFSNKVVAQALRQEVQNDPQVQEHLGDIQSLNMNLMETGTEKNKRGDAGNWVVMDAVGSKGNGKFIIESAPPPNQGQSFKSIELRLPDGETLKIK